MSSPGYRERTIGEWAACVEKHLGQLGLAAPGGSRIARMLEVFHEVQEILPDDRRFPTAQESMRDLRMMGFSLEELVGHVPHDVLVPKVRQALKDAVSPVGKRRNTRGRDAQCELYAAAICQRAGLAPEFAEPDIVCRAGDVRYGLAVKRLQSVGRFQDRFRECCKQIEKSRLPGYAVMDLSLAANPQNAPVNVPIDDPGFDRLVGDWCDKEFGSRFAWMKNAMRGREVRGLIVLTHFIQYKQATKSWGLRSFTWTRDLSPDNMRRTREFEVFFSEFRKGLPTGPN